MGERHTYVVVERDPDEGWIDIHDSSDEQRLPFPHPDPSAPAFGAVSWTGLGRDDETLTVFYGWVTDQVHEVQLADSAHRVEVGRHGIFIALHSAPDAWYERSPAALEVLGYGEDGGLVARDEVECPCLPDNPGF